MTKQELKEFLQEVIKEAYEPHRYGEPSQDYFDGKVSLAEDVILMLDELKEE